MTTYTLDFANIPASEILSTETDDGGEITYYSTIDLSGFSLTNTGFLVQYGFVMFDQTVDNNNGIPYDGSGFLTPEASAYSSPPTTFELTSDNGAPFSFQSIQLDNADGFSTVTVTVIGTLPGGSQVATTITKDGNVNGDQTFTFGSQFDDVTSVTFQSNTDHLQFNNIVVVPSTPPPTVSSPSLAVAENAAATAIGIVAPSDTTYTASQLVIMVSTLPTDGTVTLADGVTPVTVNETLSATQLTGLEFTPTHGAFSTSSTFTYTVTDPTGEFSTGTATLIVGAPTGSSVAPTDLAQKGTATNGGTIEITGHGDLSGDTITVYGATSGGAPTEIGTTTVLSDDTFDFKSTAPADGSYTITATETGTDGTSGQSASAPAIVTATAPTLKQKGTATNGGTIEVTGTGDAPGDTITLYADGNTTTVVGVGTVNGDGTFDITTTADFTDGEHTLTATNTSADGTETSAMSTAAPATVAATAPTGLVQVGTSANGSTIEITGTGDAVGDTIKLYNGATQVGSGIVGANGKFDITTSAIFADGTYAITATDTSVDGTQTSAMSAPAGSFAPQVSALVSFNGSDGANPEAGLISDSAGNLYGTTAAGGASGDGTVFEYVKSGGAVQTLATFTGANGANPEAGLVADSAGNLYGTTAAGGASGDGTVFEIVKGSGAVQTLATFTGANGADPLAGLIADSAGNLYGTTAAGGASGDGTVFEIAHGSGTVTTLASFAGADGKDPVAGLTVDSAGNLYGTTELGGSSGEGTVFEIVKSSGALETLATFTGANGAEPAGALIADSAGNLYGTTDLGGAFGDGTVFEIVKGSGALQTLASFDLGDGANPEPGLLIDSAGNLYGATSSGGASGYGTVFEYVKNSGALQTLVSFESSYGQVLGAGLIADSAGNFYGTTESGGTSNDGTIFELLTPGVTVTATAPTGLAQNGVAASGETIEITGTGDAEGDTITLYDGSTAVGSGIAGAGGVFDFSTSATFVDGTYTLTATDTSANGPETSAMSTSALTVNVDPNAPGNLAVMGRPVNGQDVTVTGTGETVNNTITLYNGTTELGTTMVGAGGTFSFTTTSPLADGVYGFTATETDSSNLTSAQSAALTVDVDPNAPGNLAVMGQPVNGQDVTVTGTGETVNDTITLYNGTTELGTTMVGANGTFSFTTTSPLADGVYGFTATETDPSNLTSAKSALTVDVDPNAPGNLAVMGQPVNGQNVTVTGTGETVNDTITLYNGTTELGTTMVGAGGTFSFTTTSPLADGVYGFTATETDSSNLTSAQSAALTVDVDPNAPGNLVVMGQPVNGQDVTVTGTGETVNDTITLYNGTTELGTTMVGAGGTFSFTTTSPLADGVYGFTATETDSSNLTSAKSALAVDVDPNAPVITTLVGQPVNGGAVELQGTGEVGDTVDLYADGNTTTIVGTGKVGAGGTFDITTSPTAPFADGVHSFTATQTDTAGLTSAPPSPVTQSYGYSGKIQKVTVATTGIYDITAYGAQGGNWGAYGSSAAGGRGAEIEGKFSLTAGETLEIVVGGAGGASSRSGGGGGGSFVLANTGPGGSYVPLVVAGGGGGAILGQAGGAGSTSAGSGFGGAGGGNGSGYGGGGGGAGIKGAGGAGDGYFDVGTGGQDFRGGRYADTYGQGGGGGGYGGGGSGYARSGGGGGGYSGGNGGYKSSGGGGGSIDKGTSVLATAGENAGNGKVIISSVVTPFTVDVEATAPTGLAQVGTASNGGTIEISGTGDAVGDTITLYDGNTVVGSGTAGAGGAFDIVTTQHFADGTDSITATDKSADGTETSVQSSAVNAVVTSVAPTGLAQEGTASNGGEIKISGTGDAVGDTITLYNGNTAVGSGTAGAGGAFDIVTTQNFADGTYSLTATDTSADGTKTSGPSSAVNAVVISNAPTGLMQVGTVSNDGTIEISGTGDAVGDTITLYNGNTVVGSGTAGAGGAFDIVTKQHFVDGTDSLTATDTSADGTETSGPSSAVNAVVSSVAPTGLAQVGTASNGGTIEISGTGDAVGDTITLYNGNTAVGSGLVVAGDTFEITTSATFADGTYSLTATDTSADGTETSGPSSAVNAAVDPNAPAITTLVGQPLTGQAVELQGTGEAGDTVDLYADGNTNTIVGTGTVGAGGSFDITTTAMFGTGPHTFTATETDAANLASTQSTPAFQVNVVHQAPAITAGGAATFDGAGPVVLDAGVTVSDVDSGGTLAGATVSIGSGLAGDTLEIGGQTNGTLADSGGTISYTFAGSTLTLSGTDTLADYQAALDSITYSFSPIGGDATTGGADTSRTISWQVSDGSASNGASNVATSTLSVPTTPVVTATAPNVNATASQSFTAAQLFGASDAAGEPILTYEVKDESSGPNQGFWVLDGAVLTNGQITTLTAAQLAELSFVAGSAGAPVTDTLEVAASDAAGLGAFAGFTVTASAHASTAAPTVTAANELQAPGLTLAASSLFSGTAFGGNSIVSYEVEDTTPDSGHWIFNGTIEPTNQVIDVTVAQLAQLSFETGYGSDTLTVRANDGSQWGSLTSFTVTPPPNAAPPAGTTDTLVMLRNANGAIEFYDIGRNQVLLDGPLGQINPALQVAGVGGFDGSDTADLLMRDPTTGAFTLYDVSNNNITGNVALGQVGPEWTVSGFGDFSGHAGETDMVMRNANTGAFEVYDISNNTVTSAAPLGQVGLEWQVAGFGDFSGNPDGSGMLLRNSNTGAFEVYDIANNTVTSATGMGQVGTEWQVAGFGDFSGRADETDMLMRNSNTGAFEVYDIVNNAVTFAAGMGQVGLEWTVAGFGDFSGNANETDMLMRNANTGAFELYDISNNTVTSAASMGQVGLEWSVSGIAANSASAPPSSATAQLTQAMASFAPTSAAPDGNGPFGQAPAQSAAASSALVTPAGEVRAA